MVHKVTHTTNTNPTLKKTLHTPLSMANRGKQSSLPTKVLFRMITAWQSHSPGVLPFVDEANLPPPQSSIQFHNFVWCSETAYSGVVTLRKELRAQMLFPLFLSCCDHWSCPCHTLLTIWLSQPCIEWKLVFFLYITKLNESSIHFSF